VDERSAFTWFDRAMSAGDTAATVPLAQCYLQGRGTPHDLALAVDLLVKAAASGDPGAKDLLVQAARLGNAEAANWCRQRGVAY
jgi:TPR repeat protein